MNILIAGILTIVAVSAWHLMVIRRTRAKQQLMVSMLLKDLEDLAKELGHEGYLEYLQARRGKEYAAKTAANVRSLLASLSARGRVAE